MRKITGITAFASAIALMIAGSASAHNLTHTETVTYNFPAVGHGDVTGVCFNQVPENPPEIWSCIDAAPIAGDDMVAITVTDSASAAPYISVQQEGNPNFAWGCGTVQFGDVVTDASHPGVFFFPVVDSGAGGGPAEPVKVFPWAAPGINDFETPPNPCSPGSTNLGGGTAVFDFYNHVA